MQLNSLNYCTRVEDISAPRGHSDMPGSVVSIISINRIREVCDLIDDRQFPLH